MLTRLQASQLGPVSQCPGLQELQRVLVGLIS